MRFIPPWQTDQSKFPKDVKQQNTYSLDYICKNGSRQHLSGPSITNNLNSRQGLFKLYMFQTKLYGI